MSFTPSIGDVISLIQTLINVYNKVQEAPSEIDAAIQDVKGMKAELESMRDKVGDEKYFVKKNGEAMFVSALSSSLRTLTSLGLPLSRILSSHSRRI
jgi:hypothetical protein